MKSPSAADLLHALEHDQTLQWQPVAGKALDPRLAMLRAWQSRRLRQTYADLQAEAQYRAACEFILSDVYAPRDFSQRDDAIERLHAFLARLVPAPMIELLTDSIEMGRLTYALDNALLDVLVNRLGVTDTITPEMYAEGYRLCRNYAERTRQIDLVVKILKQVGEGAHLPAVGLAMKMVRGPAQRAGWGELYASVERGYAAFKCMRDVDRFVRVIERRERAILDKIFARSPAPFSVW